MSKGISPIVASVLLIAITIAIAAILANWVTSYTQSSLPQTNCIGGSISFVSTEFPKWTTDNRIRAIVEAHYVALSDFKFTVLMNDDKVYIYNDVNDLELAAGAMGTIETDPLLITKANIKSVQITTSCADVKTDLTTLK
jgi:flagellin-like protein